MSGEVSIAKAFKPESDFVIRIFRRDIVKILVNTYSIHCVFALLIKKSVGHKILRPKRSGFFEENLVKWST